ncbi:cleavage and polyadenylation specificity factor subunit 4-like [Diaphorina citri]|uniref:Cleavage and polyadenylation specificity factor subunit 4 n=1 Tax=Diaphorina citri TaxID=121845 RepID=A0A3Q0JDC5_DIACI|nr:cleavage and polyadenylation specificity factor subunit 4-like [Diaphorina citri]
MYIVHIGDQCEFLHEYDMTKMPECYFYSRFNACHNKECPFLHIDPDSKIKDCPWYDRGFCRHGPSCRHRHVRRVLCMNYLCGFCPDGPDCKFMHPRFELPTEVATKKLVVVCHFCGASDHRAMHCPVTTAELIEKEREIQRAKKEAEKQLPTEVATKKLVVVCHFCGASDHRAMHCPVTTAELIEKEREIQRAKKEAEKQAQIANNVVTIKQEPVVKQEPRPPLISPCLISFEISAPPPPCFKCGNKGHYANKCPKGHLAFLTLSNNTNIKSELEAFQARRHLKQEKMASQNLYMSQQQPHHQQHSYPHGVPQSMYHTNLYQQQQQQEMKHNPPPPPSDQNQQS